MCHPEVVEIRPNVASYLRGLIEEWNKVNEELEMFLQKPAPKVRVIYGVKLAGEVLTLRLYNEKTQCLRSNVAAVVEEINAIIAKHIPSIAVNPDPKITIANLELALEVASNPNGH